MRIAIIIDHLYTDKAGTENQVIKLIRGLGERLEIDLVSLRETEWLVRMAPTLPCSVTIFDLNNPMRAGYWIALFRVMRFLRSRQPDVVHTFFPVANIFGVLCARLAGVNAIVSSRRDYGHWMNRRYVAATCFANRFVNRIVSNSDQVKQLTVDVEGFPAANIAVIYNGVEIEQFVSAQRHEKLKAELGIPAHHKVFTMVGNFRPIKSHSTLLEATHELLRSRSDISVLFVGKDNGNLPEVMSRVAKLGMGERVFVASAEGNVHEFLSFTDVGVNCSESEGLSNAVIEYMAAGVPCVVSDGGGNVDLISTGTSGLVFPVGDAHLLAQQLARFLDDEPLRQRCIEAARRRVLLEMRMPVMLERFDDFYSRLGASPPGANQKSTAPLGGTRFRSTLSAIANMTASSGPLIRAARNGVASKGVTVFLYHELGTSSDDAEAWQVVRRDDFLRQVDFLRRHYRLMSLDQAFEGLADDARGDRPAAVITFDDGHKGLLQHLLPLVQRESIPVAIYLATGHILDQQPFWFDRVVNALQSPAPLSLDLSAVGLGHHEFGRDRGAANWTRIQALLSSIKKLPPARCEVVADEVARQTLGNTEQLVLAPLTISEVKDLGNEPLITLGAHTHGHEVLTRIPNDVARHSIQRSSDLLYEWTGQSVRHFAYPAGFRNESVETLVRSMGFESAMGTHRGIWTKADSVFAIPRIPVGRYDTMDKFKVNSVLGLRSIASNLLS